MLRGNLYCRMELMTQELIILFFLNRLSNSVFTGELSSKVLMTKQLNIFLIVKSL